MSGLGARLEFVSFVSFHLLAQLEISLAISPTACCSKPDSSHFSLLLQDFVQDGARHDLHLAPVCFSCSGSGSASTSNPALPRSRVASPNGDNSPRWTSITRTAPCPPGSGGTCSICRTGFMPRRYTSRSH